MGFNFAHEPEHTQGLIGNLTTMGGRRRGFRVHRCTVVRDPLGHVGNQTRPLLLEALQ